MRPLVLSSQFLKSRGWQIYTSSTILTIFRGVWIQHFNRFPTYVPLDDKWSQHANLFPTYMYFPLDDKINGVKLSLNHLGFVSLIFVVKLYWQTVLIIYYVCSDHGRMDQFTLRP